MPVRAHWFAAAVLLVLSACTNASGGSIAAEPTPGSTQLAIMVRDGPDTTTWQLTCDPVGGSHPNPERACQALATEGAAALPPVSKDTACPEIWGGAQTATLTGTWRGNQVESSFSRVNGCEIDRWDKLAGLLPPGGI